MPSRRSISGVFTRWVAAGCRRRKDRQNQRARRALRVDRLAARVEDAQPGPVMIIGCIEAVDQGYAPSEFNLGGIYEKGQGVSQGYVRAVMWYRKAAD